LTELTCAFFKGETATSGRRHLGVTLRSSIMPCCFLCLWLILVKSLNRFCVAIRISAGGLNVWLLKHPRYNVSVFCFGIVKFNSLLKIFENKEITVL